jgi:hypothetical protein
MTPQELKPVKPDLGQFELVPTNPAVLAVSKALHWKPETAIIHIQRALPAKFEQQVYLRIGPDFGMKPESLAKILSIYRGSKPLCENDRERYVIGENLVVSSLSEASDFIEACMDLVKVIAKEYPAFGLSHTLAALIVQAYGTDSPEQVVEMIDTNLDELCEYFEVGSKRSYSERMRICVYLFIQNLLPELRRRGVPNPLDLDEFIHGTLGKEETDIESLEFKQKLHTLLNGDGTL